MRCLNLGHLLLATRPRLRAAAAKALPSPSRGASSTLHSPSRHRDSDDPMAWRSHGHDNDSLVAALLHNGVFQHQRVADAMRRVDRPSLVATRFSSGGFGRALAGKGVGLGEHCQLANIDAKHALRGRYVLPELREEAYYDNPLPIGFNQTISAPHMHATCAELLEEQLRPGATVLDVGSGSGYLAAVFAQMVGPAGRVVGVEVVPQLVERSKIALRDDPSTADMVAAGTVSIHHADAHWGMSAHAPYDAIHVGAAAEAVPQALVDQLKDGGRMIIPVGRQGQAQVLAQVDKDLEGRVHHKALMGVQYVPLVRSQQ